MNMEDDERSQLLRLADHQMDVSFLERYLNKHISVSSLLITIDPFDISFLSSVLFLYGNALSSFFGLQSWLECYWGRQKLFNLQ